MVDISERNARLFQTIGDGLGGKTGPVLDTAKALFFHGRNQDPVAHQRG